MALPSDIVSEIENAHSSTTPLAGGASFTPGVPIDMRTHGALVASVLADQSGTLYVESSPDARDGNGAVNASAHWDYSVSQAVTANVREELRLAPPYQYARVRYTNGATLQGVFRLQTTLRAETGSAGSGVSAPGGGALATAAKQDTGNTSLASIDGKLPATLGATTPALSVSVTGSLSSTALLTAADATASGSAATPASMVAGPSGIRVQNTSATGQPNIRVGDTGNVAANRGTQVAPGASEIFAVTNANLLRIIAESGSPTYGVSQA